MRGGRVVHTRLQSDSGTSSVYCDLLVWETACSKWGRREVGSI